MMEWPKILVGWASYLNGTYEYRLQHEPNLFAENEYRFIGISRNNQLPLTCYERGLVSDMVVKIRDISRGDLTKARDSKKVELVSGARIYVKDMKIGYVVRIRFEGEYWIMDNLFGEPLMRFKALPDNIR